MTLARPLLAALAIGLTLGATACIGDELKNRESSDGQGGSIAKGGSAGTAGTPAGGGSGGTNAGGTNAGGTNAGGTAGGGTDAGSGGAAGAATIPKTDLILWLDAMHISDGIDAGNAVSTWVDQSTNGKDAFQADDQVQPVRGSLNGKPAVWFSGQSYLDLPNGFALFSSGLAIFAVVAFADNTEACEAILHLSNGDAVQNITLKRGALAGPDTEMELIIAGQTTKSALNVTNTSVVLIGARNYLPGLGQIYLNGVTSGPSSTLAFPEMVLRQDNHIGKAESTCNRFNGAMQELLVYKRELDASEQDQVNQYLMKKWM